METFQATADLQTSARTSSSSFHSAPTAVVEAEVLEALHRWGQGLVAIGKAYEQEGAYVEVAKKVLETSYAYELGDVLFKPTLASQTMFRKTLGGALSYFVGGNVEFSEDRGFALRPWRKVEFDVAGISTGKDYALVMGNKLLTDSNGHVTLANFSMAFVRTPQGDLKIKLHHSSLPYQPLN